MNSASSLIRTSSAHAAGELAPSFRLGVRRFTAACSQFLQELKERLTAELTREFAGLLDSKTIRRVVEEANSLAVATPFPALFLPTLAEEKVRVASLGETRRQASRSRPLTISA
jgi:hypothetical protein